MSIQAIMTFLVAKGVFLEWKNNTHFQIQYNDKKKIAKL